MFDSPILSPVTKRFLPVSNPVTKPFLSILSPIEETRRNPKRRKIEKKCLSEVGLLNDTSNTTDKKNFYKKFSQINELLVTTLLYLDIESLVTSFLVW